MTLIHIFLYYTAAPPHLRHLKVKVPPVLMGVVLTDTMASKEGKVVQLPRDPRVQ